MERKNKRNEIMDSIASSESLTTSTESESFETWTLVTEGAKKRPNKAILETQEPLIEEDRVEIIEKDETNKRDNENVDDLSDGISIISDNESAGRASPNSLIGESSTDKNYPMITEISSTEFEVHEGNKNQYESITPPVSPKEIEICSQIEALLHRSRTNQKNESSSEQIPRTFLGIGVRGVFYLSIFIALAAFIGRLKYPEWEQLSLSSQITPLTQRIEDLELQNNLLRAEIDLLNKQVYYLSQQKERFIQKDDIKNSHRQEGKQYESKIREKTKIWPGAGDINLGEPIEVNFKPSSKEYDKPKSSIPETRKKDVPNTNSKEYPEKKSVKEDENKFDKEKNVYENNRKYPKDNYPTQDEKFDYKHPKHDNGRYYERDNRRKDQSDFNSRESSGDDKTRKQRKREWESDYSRESREQYQNHKRDKNLKHEDDWHEKMMQNREDARKKHEQRNTNNWYIERGNSREEARVTEHGDQ